ncbi:uncharacterized protein LOC116847462 isoform X2 [Odontomachus brunneus]|uniref:uncharacterized protein LOC116847462 isoform X2 n=1 Tax=Odontomachus brunneus TaxID=486640 RepID=UPI0013F25429|nr:uncharacterized protein LOC116847462 isoform X2 [Odontomachus brunneus]
MTTFFIILVLLLTGCPVRGVTENVLTTSGHSTQLRVESVEKATRCVLETNRAQVLAYTPDDRKIRRDIDRNDYDWISNNETCSVTIRSANSTHAGVWRITTVARDDEHDRKKTDTRDDNATAAKVFAFNLYVQEKVDLPFKDIEVYEGHYINIKHVNDYENLTACNLTGPSQSVDLLAETRDDFQLFGQCGVRMKVHVNSSGFWQLVAFDNDFVLYVASFGVTVHQLEEVKQPDPANMLVLQWVRGNAGVIRLPVSPEICQIVDPSGAIVAISRRQCYHNVKVATVLHEGVWLARYNIYGMLDPVELRFRVVTVDSITLSASVNYTENSGVRLLCRLESWSATFLQTCNFVRPDSRTIYITPVVANERYSAYISPAYGYTSKVLECGITIRELASVDYGAWRCDLGVRYSTDMHGSVLYVGQPGSRDGNTDAKGRAAVETRAEDVHVKRGDSFTIKCAVDFALKYCWLRSPNGTAYSVTQGKDVQFGLHYEGDGLSYGECGARISAAVNSDGGQWNCYMGVVDGDESNATVSVTVTESYLAAEQTEIAVSPRNDPVLSCHILPRMLDRTVHYCRWIRPDGYGIYNDISHRYTTNSSYSQCRLVILNYSSKEDEGRWTCVAGLAGSNGQLEEAWAHVKLLSRVTELKTVASFMAITLGSSLLIIVVLAVSFVARRVLVKKNTPILKIPQKTCTPPNTFQSVQDPCVMQDKKHYVY